MDATDAFLSENKYKNIKTLWFCILFHDGQRRYQLITKNSKL